MMTGCRSTEVRTSKWEGETMVCGAGDTKGMGDEAGNAFPSVHNKNERPSVGEVTILSGSLDVLLNTSNGKVMNVDGGYYLIESGGHTCDGEPLCYSFYGHYGIGKLMGGAFITQYGEAIEGDCLDDIEVLGKVTFMIASVHDNNRPVI